MNSIKKILVIHKRSSLELAKRFKNKHILNLVEKNDPSVGEYVDSHNEHISTLKFLRKEFDKYKTLQIDFIERDKAKIDGDNSHLYDLVLAVGGDGTFIWVSKLVGGNTPIMGVNSNPKHSVGFYTCTSKKDFQEKFSTVLASGNDFPKKKIERLSLSINGRRIQDRILNDVLFAASHPAAMTSYILSLPHDSKEKILSEHQRSSGLWVSTPCGSTGANLSAGGQSLSIVDSRLQFVVREPMKNFNTGIGYRILHGFCEKEQNLTVISKTRKALVAIDGTTLTYPVTTGDVMNFSISNEPLTILGK